MTIYGIIKEYKGVAMNKFFTVEETAKYLRVHPKTIKRWISEKRLKAFRLGLRKLGIREKHIKEFINANTDK